MLITYLWLISPLELSSHFHWDLSFTFTAHQYIFLSDTWIREGQCFCTSVFWWVSFCALVTLLAPKHLLFYVLSFSQQHQFILDYHFTPFFHAKQIAIKYFLLSCLLSLIKSSLLKYWIVFNLHMFICSHIVIFSLSGTEPCTSLYLY